jgi:hypothetical protein
VRVKATVKSPVGSHGVVGFTSVTGASGPAGGVVGPVGGVVGPVGGVVGPGVGDCVIGDNGDTEINISGDLVGSGSAIFGEEVGSGQMQSSPFSGSGVRVGVGVGVAV